MEIVCSTAGTKERQVANSLEARLPRNVPRIVAITLLKEALERKLGVVEEREASDRQLEFVKELCSQLGEEEPNIQTKEEASAWIRVLVTKVRMQDLTHLLVERGDVVRRISDPDDAVLTVSSIGEDGRVHFMRGGNSTPHRLEVVARVNDRSPLADRYRKVAANRAASRASRTEWSTAKARGLQAYHVGDPATEDEISHLETVIDDATDERPIQKYLAKHPSILGLLLRGPVRYCLPLVRLGREYVPDFMLADVDSRGVRWILVELETPRSTVGLSSKKQFDAMTRNAIGQIHDWREWLQDNLDYARRPIANSGLGLTDIRPGSEGLILVGRRETLSVGTNQLRNQLWESDRILIRSYDGLLEDARARVNDEGGAWAWNPHVLPRWEENFEP
jgi:Domain of unknown function (DUF4263)